MSVTATGTAAVDRLDEAFDVVAPIDLALVFTGWGPLPAIRHVEDQSGPWDHVGVHRGPRFSDGGSAVELMTHHPRPGCSMRKGLAASIREAERVAGSGPSRVD